MQGGRSGDRLEGVRFLGNVKRVTGGTEGTGADREGGGYTAKGWGNAGGKGCKKAGDCVTKESVERLAGICSKKYTKKS